jgi:hypothetical protein
VASGLLARLKKVELREAWRHEANDFTKWLAEDENLRLLADEIGFDLKLIQVEAAVGDFNADILAEEENTGRKIIIENQLELTNHAHLGQIITYASGYDAGVIVWVVRDVREEHRQALDWLNTHTDDTIEFYLVKIELWQIGDSPFAPKFDVICKPNDWAKAVKGATESRELSETKASQLEFWTRLKEYAQQRKSKVRLQKPSPQHWTNVPIGSSEAHVALTVNSRDGGFGVELYISNNKELYERLLVRKDEIERDLGEALVWMALPEKKASRIKVTMDGDFDQKTAWDGYFQWLLTEAEKFQAVFPKNMKDSAPWTPGEQSSQGPTR